LKSYTVTDGFGSEGSFLIYYKYTLIQQYLLQRRPQLDTGIFL